MTILAQDSRMAKSITNEEVNSKRKCKNEHVVVVLLPGRKVPSEMKTFFFEIFCHIMKLHEWRIV